MPIIEIAGIVESALLGNRKGTNRFPPLFSGYGEIILHEKIQADRFLANALTTI